MIIKIINIINLLIILFNIISCSYYKNPKKNNKLKILNINQGDYILNLQNNYKILLFVIPTSNNIIYISHFNKYFNWRQKQSTPFFNKIMKNNINYYAIKKLTYAFFSKSSLKNFNIFNQIKQFNKWKTFNSLKIELNNCNKTFLDNFIQNIKKFNNNYNIILNIQNTFLLIYNLLWKMYKKNIICEIVDKINLVNNIDNYDTILGQTIFQQNNIYKKQIINIKKEIYEPQYIGININFWFKIKTIFNELISKYLFLNWKNGFLSSPFVNSVLIHEFGHIIHNIYKYWYFIDIIQSLKIFIIKKIKNLQILKIKNWNLIWQCFAISEYALRSDDEWFAENFAYWLLTPEKWRTKVWEILNEYFLQILINDNK